MVMGDPVKRSSVEERIVEAAAQLFSRHGFNGTRTREIARLANVNQTTLFRYFARKRDLFWAALRFCLSRVHVRRKLWDSLAEGGDPHTVLPMILEFLAQTVQYQPELMRLLSFTALELPADTLRVYRDELGPIFGAIHNYLQGCVDRAALRPVDPFMTTVAFATLIPAHQALYSLLKGTALPYASTEEAVRAYADFWVGALVLTNSADRPASSQRALASRAGKP